MVVGSAAKIAVAQTRPTMDGVARGRGEGERLEFSGATIIVRASGSMTNGAFA